MPLAARTLGREEFGIYATVSMSLFAVNLLQLGVGPAAAKGISEAAAASDREREARIYWNGTILVLSLGILAVSLIGLVVGLVPIPLLFGAAYAPWAPVMIPGLLLASALLAGEFLAAFQDRIREGYMEASVANAWAAAANMLCAIAVILGMTFHPSVCVLLVCVFVPNILARIVNGAFLLRKRPYLLSWRSRPERTVMAGLISDGLSFSATRTIVYLVEYNLCALVVGRLLGPGPVAIFQVLMSLNTAFVGLMIMVGTPTWAALIDARAHGDRVWMARSTGNFYRFLAACFVPVATGLIFFGPWILRKWYGPEFIGSHTLFAAHSVLLLALGWREVNHHLCIGLGKLRDSVRPILLGLGLGFTLGIAGLHMAGLWGLFFGLGIGTLLIPGRRLPALVGSEVQPLVPLSSCDLRGMPSITPVP